MSNAFDTVNIKQQSRIPVHTYDKHKTMTIEQNPTLC